MVTEQQASQAVRILLEYIGENPDREGLKETPKRFLKAWREDFFKGYNQNPSEILSKVFFETGGYTQPVIMRNIKFYSYCEHHIVPIIGKVHIAYKPRLCVVGISKLVRLVEVYARRLQVQERFTNELALALQKHLDPCGTAVLVEAEHLCMTSRGVNTQSQLITTCFTGLYDNSDAHRVDILKQLRGSV